MPVLQARLKPRFNQVFDKVIVINLARRSDRLANIAKQLDAYGIEFERFEAIDAQDLGISGAQACAMSHCGVFEKYKDASNIFIFEDDAELTLDFNQQWNTFIDNLPDDWQMIYLGCNKIGFEKPINGVARLLAGIATHAYGAKQSMFKSLIRASKGAEPVDLSYMQLQMSVPVYVAIPSMVGQVAGFSDIENRFTDYKYALG
jgi:GR25 family glycosyltransferase involved in LPS biosynthesis